MSKILPRVRKWLSRIMVIITIVWGLSWLITWSLPSLLNLAEIKTQIEHELKKETTLIVDLGKITIRPSVFQGLKIITQNTTIDYQNKSPLLTTGRFELRVPYWTLITQQKFQLRHIYLSKTRILSSREGIRTFFNEYTAKEGTSKATNGPTMSAPQAKKPEDDFVLMQNMDIHLSDVLWRETIANKQSRSIIVPKYNLISLFTNNPVKANGDLIIQDPSLSPGTVKITMEQTMDPVIVHSGRLDANTLKKLELKINISPYKNPIIRAKKPLKAQNLYLAYSSGKRTGNLKLSTKMFDAGILQSGLNFLSTFTDQKQYLLEQPYQLAGTFKADSKLSFNLKKLSKGHFYLSGSQGYWDLSGLNFLRKTTPLLKKIDGKILFKKENISLDSITARLNTQPIIFDGTIHPNNKTVNTSIKGSNVSVGEIRDIVTHLATALRVNVPDISRFKLAGVVDINMLVHGSYDQLTYGGTIAYKKGRLSDALTGLKLTELSSDIRVDEPSNQIYIQKFSGLFNGNPFSINGFISMGNGENNLSVDVEHIDLSLLAKELETARLLPEEQLTMLSELSGTITANLKITGSRSHPSITGSIDGETIALKLPSMKQAIKINTLQASITDDTLQLAPTQLQFGPVNIEARGTLNAAGKTDFHLASSEISTSTFRDNQQFFENLINQPIPELWNTAGSSQFSIDITGTNINTNISLSNISASWKDGDFPIQSLNGNLYITGTLNNNQLNNLSVISNDIQFGYGNTTFKPALQLSQNNSSQIQFSTEGDLSPLLVNHFLTPKMASHAPYGHIPFAFQLNGKAPALFRNKDFYTQQELTGLLNLDLSDFIEEDAFLKASLTVQDDSIQLKEGQLHLSKHSDIWAEGHVERLFSGQLMGYDFHILTGPTIELSEMEEHFDGFFKKSEGYLAADLEIHGNQQSAQKIDGWVELSEIRIPKLKIANITGGAEFEEDKVDYDFRTINLPGVQISATATSDNALTYPVPLENVAVSGSSFSLPGFQFFMEKSVRGVLLKEVTSKFLRPWQEGDPIVPVTYHDANITLNEVIYENIILESLTSRMSLYPNGTFEFKKTALETAGGTAGGYISMSPQNNGFTTVELKTQHVKANALTRALLGVSNQIFGDVNSNIRFTTEGHTDSELLDNANGLVRFDITNGRLPSIAKIETLLTAANILRGGVLGLNLNNLFRTMAPFKTNYFAEMNGDLFIADKTLHTDNLLSDGENLDLLIEGRLGMETGNADMLITGKMSQDVSGSLGKIGSLSIGKLFKYIPLLGYLPGKNNRGLIYQIPGLGYTPGLGGQARKFNQFQVVLDGPVEDPASVKSFRWLKSTDF